MTEETIGKNDHAPLQASVEAQCTSNAPATPGPGTVPAPGSGGGDGGGGLATLAAAAATATEQPPAAHVGATADAPPLKRPRPPITQAQRDNLDRGRRLRAERARAARDEAERAAAQSTAAAADEAARVQRAVADENESGARDVTPERRSRRKRKQAVRIRVQESDESSSSGDEPVIVIKRRRKKAASVPSPAPAPPLDDDGGDAYSDDGCQIPVPIHETHEYVTTREAILRSHRNILTGNESGQSQAVQPYTYGHSSLPRIRY